MTKKPKYTKQPESDEAVQERLLWVLKAMLGEVDKTEAAKKLGLSRTQLHNLVNQTAQALVDSVTPKKGGRPPRSTHERQLEEENERLRRDNERLRQRVETVDRLLGVASEMMKGRIQATPRSKKKSPTSIPLGKQEKEEPDGALELLRGVHEMRDLGLRAPLAAAVAGVSTSTVRRWGSHERQGLPLRQKRGGGPRAVCEPAAAAKAEQLLRTLRGCVGARTLSKTAGHISRRQAARIKRETLTAMERERKTARCRVHFTVPGVVRGFDAMYVSTRQGTRYALIAADAAIPFRTSAAAADTYDSRSVAESLERDMRKHGAPLVYRLDRASCHKTDEVDEVLAAAGVLRLHGPPRHPWFYGQLERQNREHREWLDTGDELDADALGAELEHMRRTLNAVRPRPMLSFRTAEEMWKQRPTIDDDRSLLGEAVADHVARLMHGANPPRIDFDFARRTAIEQALTQRGYLHCQFGGWC